MKTQASNLRQSAAENKTTVIVGLGNPILSDDGVGIQVARKLRERIANRPDIEIIEAPAGGLRLLDLLVGYKRAIIIDAMETASEPGTIRRFSSSDLRGTRNISSSHDTSLANALETGRTLGLAVPQEVIVFGIEAAVVDVFSETLSEPVAKAVPAMIETALGLIAVVDGPAGKGSSDSETGVVITHAT